MDDVGSGRKTNSHAKWASIKRRFLCPFCVRRNSCAQKLRSYCDGTSTLISTAQKRNDPLAQVLWVTRVASVQVNSLCVIRAGARDHMQGQLPAASYIKDAVAVQQSTSFLLCIESRSSTSTTPSTCSNWCV